MHLERKSEPNCDPNIDSQPPSPVDTGKQGEKLGIMLHFISKFCQKTLMESLLRMEFKVIHPQSSAGAGARTESLGKLKEEQLKVAPKGA